MHDQAHGMVTGGRPQGKRRRSPSGVAGGGGGGGTQYEEQWERSHEKLRAFVSAPGGAYPSRHTTAAHPTVEQAEERRLGNWVKRQRCVHRAGSMRAERKARLQELPRWSWDGGTQAGRPVPRELWGDYPARVPRGRQQASQGPMKGAHALVGKQVGVHVGGRAASGLVTTSRHGYRATIAWPPASQIVPHTLDSS